jgi:hypothetical protein
MSSSSFNSNEFELAYPPGIENHYWTISRISILYAHLMKHELVNKKILEIGCGKGIVVHGLRKKNVECYGVEIASVKPVEEMSYIISGRDATHLPPDFRDTIEVILLLDVIEHIEHVETFLLSLKVSFVNAQYFLVAVPAGKKLWSNYDEFYGHFRRYDLRMMDQLAQTLNFKVMRSQYVFHLLYYIGILSHKIFKTRPVKLIAPKGIMKFIHYLLASMLVVDYKLLPGRLSGSSIITLYQS